jgi:ribosome maturation factor RimP
MALELPGDIRPLLESACEAQNATLIDVVLRGTKERMILELYVDTPAGISLEQCESINRALLVEAESNAFLDAIRSIEVSSPGTDRPLIHWWQYPRNIGRMLELTYSKEQTHITESLTLLEADEQHITVRRIKKKSKDNDGEDTTFSLPYSEIQKAIVLISMN